VIELAQAALLRIVRARLIAACANFAGRVYLDKAPAEAVYPFVVMSVVGGSETNAVMAQDAAITLQIECMSEDMDAALAGAALIASELNDSAQQDAGAPVNCLGNTDTGDWHVLTATQGRALRMTDDFAGARPIYREGAQFSFVMEAK
jgi:hypothetical protein